jgi:hypothetical protein
MVRGCRQSLVGQIAMFDGVSSNWLAPVRNDHKTARFRKPGASLQGGYPPHAVSGTGTTKAIVSFGQLVFGAIDVACRSLSSFQNAGHRSVNPPIESTPLSLPIRTPRTTRTPAIGTSTMVRTNRVLGAPRVLAEGMACRPPRPPCPGCRQHRGRGCCRLNRPRSCLEVQHIDKAAAELDEGSARLLGPARPTSSTAQIKPLLIKKRTARHKGRIRNRHESHLWTKGPGFGF